MTFKVATSQVASMCLIRRHRTRALGTSPPPHWYTVELESKILDLAMLVEGDPLHQVRRRMLGKFCNTQGWKAKVKSQSGIRNGSTASARTHGDKPGGTDDNLLS